jgi:hypothetical protein
LEKQRKLKNSLRELQKSEIKNYFILLENLEEENVQWTKLKNKIQKIFSQRFLKTKKEKSFEKIEDQL